MRVAGERKRPDSTGRYPETMKLSRGIVKSLGNEPVSRQSIVRTGRPFTVLRHPLNGFDTIEFYAVDFPCLEMGDLGIVGDAEVERVLQRGDHVRAELGQQGLLRVALFFSARVVAASSTIHWSTCHLSNRVTGASRVKSSGKSPNCSQV